MIEVVMTIEGQSSSQIVTVNKPTNSFLLSPNQQSHSTAPHNVNQTS